jgi:hypothetical protein
MDVRLLAPFAAGFVVGFDVFLVELNDGVVALVHVHIEPVAFAVLLADPDARSQAAAMIAAGAVPRDEGADNMDGFHCLQRATKANQRDVVVLPAAGDVLVPSAKNLLT